MCNYWNTITVSEKLDQAINRLDYISDKKNLQIIGQLSGQAFWHLPELSKALQCSPFQAKKRLDKLKSIGLVYAPKRYPNAYMLNQLKWVKLQFLAKGVGRDLELS